MELLLTAITQTLQSGFCPPADAPHDSLQQRVPLPLSQSGWRIEYEPCPLPDSWAKWEALLPPQEDLFLNTSYLQLLGKYPPSGIDTTLAFFYQQDQLMGAMVLQFFTFSAAQQLRLADEQPNATLWQKQMNRLRLSVASCLECHVLVGGQLLATGQHGVVGAEAVPAGVLAQGLEEVARHLGRQGRHIDALLSKELPGSADHWKMAGFIALPMQPNMVLQLQPQWRTFDDYTQAMSSKYRVRLRRARKKMNGITRRELSLSDIAAVEPQLIAYYEEVISGADFSAVHVHEHYFSALKSTFPNEFRLWGYYDENLQLIGFCTALFHGDEMDAHFLGFAQSFNVPHQLYLNMLYDLVAEGIGAGVHRLVFARTAMEIKSSVGAEPESAPAYMRLRRPALHAAAPCLVEWLAPPGNWVQRHPFKEEERE